MPVIKFPKTPHIFVLPGLQVRDDKILSPADVQKFLQGIIAVEEKVDGANIGFSIGDEDQLLIQNRGNYLSMGDQPQFETIWNWAYPKLKDFSSLLKQKFILFGEWCYAVHSIHYTSLPDWFLGFDIYDKERERFLGLDSRNDFLRKLGITPVPLLAKRKFTKDELINLVGTGLSDIGGGKLEGLYLRSEYQGFLLKRAKLVRKDFAQEIDIHWSKKKMQTNNLAKT